MKGQAEWMISNEDRIPLSAGLECIMAKKRPGLKRRSALADTGYPALRGGTGYCLLLDCTIGAFLNTQYPVSSIRIHPAKRIPHACSNNVITGLCNVGIISRSEDSFSF